MAIQTIETLFRHGANPDPTDTDEMTPLHYAARNGYPEIVKVLLANGADAQKASSVWLHGQDEPMTALDFAKENGHDEIVKFLEEA